MTATRQLTTETEAEFQDAVVALAALTGWQTMHVRRSIARKGQWATTTSVAGWPDLILWKPGRFIAAELKSETGRLTATQKTVLGSLEAAGIDVRVWRPSSWPEIETTLTRSSQPTTPGEQQ